MNNKYIMLDEKQVKEILAYVEVMEVDARVSADIPVTKQKLIDESGMPDFYYGLAYALEDEDFDIPHGKIDLNDFFSEGNVDDDIFEYWEDEDDE